VSWQLASFTLLGAALIGCFAWFERSRPSSRTVALVATLAALATLGRVAFAAVPDVKPTTDIVLLAGFALGAAPGFAVGAVSALASNIFFGQGPWTPWQMLAWGLCGIAGGLVARPGWRIPRVPMALICAAAGFGYGFVLDFYTWIYAGQHTLAQYLFIEGEAFPFNLAQAIGNFLFYMAFGPGLLRALQRFRLRMDVKFVGAASLLLLIALTPIGGGAVARASTQSPAIRTELRYLMRSENRDGGFGSAPGQPSSQLYTAWAVIGIAAAGGDVAKPAAWIELHLDQLQGPGDLERTILALSAAHAPLHGLVSQLERDAAPDGSVSNQSNLTAFAILALRAAGPSGVPKAAAWLARQQNSDGGFSFAARGSPSDVDDTAAAVQALAAAGGQHAPIARAVSFLHRAENRDGGFPDEPGAPSDAQSTAWALQAFIAAGSPPAGTAYLERLTTPSGAVDYSVGVSETPVWVTAQALAALAPGASVRH
jgi:energy-coupling factor transport system substrate-specific component